MEAGIDGPERRPDGVAVGDQRDHLGRRVGAQRLQVGADAGVQLGQALPARRRPVRVGPVDDVPQLPGGPALEHPVALLAQRRRGRQRQTRGARAVLRGLDGGRMIHVTEASAQKL